MDAPKIIHEKAEIVDGYIRQYFQDISSQQAVEISALIKSMEYSASNGGKRFRPVLSLLTGDLLNQTSEKILPFAMALEFVHTYSLIHDDLPCMDDDDERRGKPTNHKVFGEDIALIAGDALLTEAFFILADRYAEGGLSRELSKLLSYAAGFRGMVGGQAIDLKAQKDGIQEQKLILMHRLKTGALIEAAVTGAALIARADQESLSRLNEFGALLGLAFQVADDILDYQVEGPEKGNFATVKGLERTKSDLQELTEKAKGCLESWKTAAAPLIQILDYNASRSV